MPRDDHRPRMNSADVFSLEFDMLTRTSSLAEDRSNGFAPPTLARQPIGSCCWSSITSSTCTRGCGKSPRTWCRPRTGAPGRICSRCRRWRSSRGASFLDDLRALGLNSLDSVSLTPLPQTIAHGGICALPAGRARDGGPGGLPVVLRTHAAAVLSAVERVHAGAVACPKRRVRALAEGAVVDTARDSVVANCCRQLVRRPRDLGSRDAEPARHRGAVRDDGGCGPAARRAAPRLGADRRRSRSGIGQVA